jgi:hypothetical protein
MLRESHSRTIGSFMGFVGRQTLGSYIPDACPGRS